MSFVRHIQQQMRNIGMMVITMISPKTEKPKTEKQVMVIMATGHGEHAGGGEPAAAGKCSGHARQGPLIKETVSGKIMGISLAAAW